MHAACVPISLAGAEHVALPKYNRWTYMPIVEFSRDFAIQQCSPCDVLMIQTAF